MGQFVYLVSEQGGPEALAEKYGLARRLGKTPPTRRCSVGLAGGRLHKSGEGCESEFDGTCLGLSNDIGVFFDTQVWEKIEEPGMPAYWLGYFKDQKPGAVDLARPAMMPGHMVTLTDGDEWLVPIARSFYETRQTLPQNLRMGADGKLIRSVKDEYRDLFDRASPIADEIYARNQASVDDEALFILATDALCVNYRVGIAEINALGLLDTQTCIAVIRALIDWPQMVELMSRLDEEEGKKKLS